MWYIEITMITRVSYIIVILIFGTMESIVSQANNLPPSIEWSRSFGSPNSDIAYDFQTTPDGGFIVVGSKEVDGSSCGLFGDTSDMWILKLDHLGVLEWEKTFGGSQHDEAIGIEKTHDDGYLILGSSESSDRDFSQAIGASDIWLLKLNAEGELEWSQSYGGSATDEAKAIISTTDGHFVLLGTTNSIDGDVEPALSNPNQDLWVVKVDTTGQVQWQKRFDSDGDINNASNFINEAGGLIQTVDGGLAIAGSAYVENNDNTSALKFWILKLDLSSGNPMWDRIYGGNNHDVAHDIAENMDGDLIVVGETRSFDGDITDRDSCLAPINHPECLDYWVVKLNDSGQMLFSKTFGGSISDAAFSVQANDDGFILGGYSKSTDGDIGNGNINSEDAWLLQLSEEADSFSIDWKLNLGSSNRDRSYMFRELSDTAYLMVGFGEKADYDITEQFGCRDIWVAKLSNNCKDGRPGKPILTGNDQYCDGSELLLSMINSPPAGPEVVYHWYTPTEVIQTPEPQLIISDLSAPLHSGPYQLIVEKAACPSLPSDTFALQVYPPIPANSLNKTLCAGDSIAVNGTFYHLDQPSGTETFVSNSPLLCDSIVYINLTFEKKDTVYRVQEITSGENILPDTQYFTNQYGCDSLVIISSRNYNPLLSPNADGINEVLSFANILDLSTYPDHRISILNRYGELVFESTDYKNDWDGSYQGKKLPADTYFYILEIPEQQLLKGYITLLSLSRK